MSRSSAAGADRAHVAAGRRDALVGVAVFAAAVLWFARQPRPLNPADESFLLFEAVRVADGERLYRDIFWLAMPGAHWALAVLYAMFGASVATAKLAMGAVNAGTTALSFAAARALGVRPALALVPALAFLALSQPAWPYVSQHWIATALLMVTLLVLAPPRAAERPRRLLAAGLALGALGALYQQKFPVIAIGLAAVVLVAAWIRRDPAAPRGPARVLLVAAGALLVLGPVLGVLLATVEVERMVDAMVRYPLTMYRPFHQHVSWGAVPPLTGNLAAYVSPRLLAWLPVSLPLAGAIAAAGCRRTWPRGRVAQWSTVLLLCGAATISIGYNDDFIHIAYVAPLYFVLLALLVETTLAQVPPPAGRLGGALLGATAAAALVAHLARNDARMRAEYPVGADTRFGRIDVRTRDEVAMSTALERYLDQTEERLVFVYPSYASLYLTAGGRNPTPYQYLHPSISFPEQIAEAIAILDARRVPVVFVSKPFLQPGDPVMAYLGERYDVAEDHPAWAVYRRRPQ